MRNIIGHCVWMLSGRLSPESTVATPTHYCYLLIPTFASILKYSITTKRQSKRSTRAHFLRFLSLSFLTFFFFISLCNPFPSEQSCDGWFVFVCLQGGGDCIQATTANGGALTRNSNTNSNQTPSSSSNDTLTMTEHQVAKLMEEDMGSAMQYLQGKGLCLMPISLATAISTATCHSRNPLVNNNNHHLVIPSNGEGPSSPSMSVLTVQSATVANAAAADSSVKDVASVSKPWSRRLLTWLWSEIDWADPKKKKSLREWRGFFKSSGTSSSEVYENNASGEEVWSMPYLRRLWQS